MKYFMGKKKKIKKPDKFKVAQDTLCPANTGYAEQSRCKILQNSAVRVVTEIR